MPLTITDVALCGGPDYDIVFSDGSVYCMHEDRALTSEYENDSLTDWETEERREIMGPLLAYITLTGELPPEHLRKDLGWTG